MLISQLSPDCVMHTCSCLDKCHIAVIFPVCNNSNDTKSKNNNSNNSNSNNNADVYRSVMSADELEEESRCCYERYRILVQNECAGG